MPKKNLGVCNIACILSLLILISTANLSSAQSVLRVTVTTYREYVDVYPYITNSSEFTYRELVSVCGEMFFNWEPVDEGLVAVQVENPENEIVAVRTVPAVEVPNESWQIEIISFYSCDVNENPRDDFNRGGNAYFYFIVKNTVPFDKQVLLTISVHDNDNTPLKTVWYGPTNIIGNGVLGFVTPDINIPEWAASGTGMAYANVYSDWPKEHGRPWRPEVNTTFNIEYSTEETFEPPEIGGVTYQASFRLPPDALLGTYNVTVNGWHKGYKDLRKTEFATVEITLGDLNLDHKINLYDATMINAAYGSKGGDPTWYPQFDLDPSGKIDLYDAVFVTAQYGMSW